MLIVLAWLTWLAAAPGAVAGLAAGRAGVRPRTLALIALALAGAAAGFWHVVEPDYPVQELIPVALVIPAALLPWRLVLLVSAILLNGFAILAGFSIGMLYAPAAVAMWAALCASAGRSKVMESGF